ncbi:MULTISPECIES: helicase-related protein [unclassified Roseitalea]|uniref:helicase-related protein n=1 Tax=unclassified Roseitalea TaxID=2639107 RepID=UPI00273FD3B2|nr:MULTISPECIES: helicase-related protein [unclassified Roseitalea]
MTARFPNPMSAAPARVAGDRVQAILGPTNTGKTHLAIERMVAHSSGVIGLPLRLLAREVYGRVAERVGTDSVALITGEEKIAPPRARYSVCTVEAMPRETDAAFVAIDEVQLAGDLERGHIFTDRLLNIRGREETLLLGAGTAAPILRQLLPGVGVASRPRMSTLSYTGPRKLTRLPRRSAIVAFSADEVYAVAELIRRQRGGAAVVMGALSPRTRNAQVQLFQSGDVDYLVATDAIGMGLNLDVDHVAFAQLRKFDGHTFRDLTPPEMAQIAGRAGRHVRDGTFGVSARVPPLDDELVERIESHDFSPLKVLQWRSRQLDFTSLGALKASLEQPPEAPGLTRALPAVDQRALEFLARDEQIARLCDRPETIERLWEVCSLPDYRKIAPAQHADIISTIFGDLVERGHVDEDYMASQVRRADRTDGEIDTLSHRIAQIRTWTYVSNRPDWLADPAHWREKTRIIEDKLSDALHERLTKRFVDRRTSVLIKRLKENTTMDAEISQAGDVTVEGHHVGKLDGFRFTADRSAEGEDARAIKAAAQKALAAEFEARADRFAAAPNADFALGMDGYLRWLGAPVASLTAGEDWLTPNLVLLADEQFTGPAQEKVRGRAQRFVSHHIETHLKPLTDLKKADELSGIARGIAFRLIENFGITQRRDIAGDIKSLDQDGRAALRRYGVRFGYYHIFVPALIKPAPAGLMTLLWAVRNDARDKPGYGDVVNLLASGRTSLVTDESFERTFYKLAGYRHLGPRAVRIDILERLADLIRPCIFWKPGSALPDGAYGDGRFVVTPAMLSILGATAEDMSEVLNALGYRHEKVDAEAAESAISALRAEHAPKPAEQQQPATTGDTRTDGEAGAASEQAPDQAPGPATQTPPQADTAAMPTPSAPQPAATATQAGPDGASEAPAGAALPEAAPAPSAPSAAAQGPDVRPNGDATAHGEPPAKSPEPSPEGAAPEGSAHKEEKPPVLVWRQARFERRGDRHRGRRTADGEDRPPRTRNARGKGKGKGKPANRPGKPGRKRADDAPRTVTARPPKRVERPADPDSPFAKLQALKDQMKK